jgi:shikimate kinase
MVKENSPPDTDRIYLTGFMGSGKSTVGKLLARLLGRTFIDLDEVIVKESGMTIPEIFQRNGEDAFRAIEKNVAARFTREKWVVALGGGTLVNPETRELLVDNGTVVFLRAKPATLAARLRGQSSHRPLLTGSETLEQRVTSLLKSRDQVYSCAHWVLDTDNLSADQVAHQLFDRIRKNPDAQLH